MWDTGSTVSEIDEAPEVRQPTEKLRDEQWSLDYVKMKKLNTIIKHVQNRKITANPYADKSRQEVRMLKIKEYAEAEKGAFIRQRLLGLGTCALNRNAVLGDEMGVRRVLDSGYPVNRRDGITGRSALHEAVGAGHFHVVKLLCGEYHADVNKPTMLGYSTALHIAVDNNYRQIASLLITYGADVNAVDKYMRTPIFYSRSLPLAKLLLRYDVDLTMRDRMHRTAAEHYEETTPINNFVPEVVQVMNKKKEERDREIQAAKAELKRQMVLQASMGTSGRFASLKQPLLLRSGSAGSPTKANKGDNDSEDGDSQNSNNSSAKFSMNGSKSIRKSIQSSKRK